MAYPIGGPAIWEPAVVELLGAARAGWPPNPRFAQPKRPDTPTAMPNDDDTVLRLPPIQAKGNPHKLPVYRPALCNQSARFRTPQPPLVAADCDFSVLHEGDLPRSENGE